MKTVYLSSAYLAPIEYYAKLLAYDKVFIEQHDHYVKQTYRNRCTIAAPDGELVLSIPTVKPATLKCPLKDIRISDPGGTCIGMLCHLLTIIRLSLNTTKMISSLSMRRNMSF